MIDRVAEDAPYHQPVMLEEVIAALDIDPDGIYADVTAGGGGHSAAILERLGPAGRLLALDRDPAALAECRRRFAGDGRVTVASSRFSELGHTLAELLPGQQLDGAVGDLGVSSEHLNNPDRGFSFMHDGPLDARMDPRSGLTAAQWLAEVDEAELVRVLREWGEERYARRIAAAIVARRTTQPLTRTAELAALIAEAVPTRERSKHVATRSFLAIRMAVNEELHEVRQGLRAAVATLRPGGRLALIAFHSIESRLVKNELRSLAGRGPDAVEPPLVRLLRVPKTPSRDEQRRNRRSRSAVLRVVERLPQAGPA